MKNITMKYLEVFMLEQKTKEELIQMVLQLQERDKDLAARYTNLYKSSRERDSDHKERIAESEKRVEDYVARYAEADAKQENYKRIVDLKLGNTYNINSTWIDKIVFVLKAAGRPLRSSEIIEVLEKNDITFRTLANKPKGLSAHLTKALKYGRIIGEKQKGQNGYLFRLP